MKITILFFVFVSTAYSGFAQNAFSEAQTIAGIVNRSKNEKGIVPPNTENELVTATLIRLLVKTRTAPNRADTDAYASPQVPANPKGGGIAQRPPAQRPAVQVQEVQPQNQTFKIEDTSNISINTRIEIRSEVRMILKIGTTECIALDSFPKQITFLEEISQGAALGVGNSGIVGGDFSNLEAKIISGITSFFISRAKEELVNVYIKRWVDTLNNDKIIQPLLSHTLGVCDAFIKDNTLSIAKYGDKWKVAFQEDLGNIPVQFQKEDYVNLILSKMKIRDVDFQKELAAEISGGDQLIYNLYLKENLVNILNDMSSVYVSDSADNLPVFKRCIIIADLLAGVCGTMTDNSSYQPVKAADLKKLSVDDWQMFIKIFYARNAEALNKSLGNSAKSMFCSLLSHSDRLARLLNQTISILSDYQISLSGLNTNAATVNQLDFDETRRVYELVFQLLNNSCDYLTEFKNDIPDSQIACKLGKLIDIYQKNIKPFLSDFSQIGEGISTKQYGKILDGSIDLIKVSWTMVQKKDSSLNGSEITNTIAYLQLYGSFMLNVLTAKDATGVETALDELIPKAQYDLKNHKRFTISLSGYPGVFAGEERIKKYQTDNTGTIDNKLPKTGSWKTSLSLYLPIGLDFNFGDYRHIKHYGSTNVFLQVIDLGAVMNYRLNADSSESSNPNISFKQLLSPGISVMRHINNSPLTIGLGANYAPELRTIIQNGYSYNSGSFRIGIFLAVDVTVLFLHASKDNPSN